MGMDHITYKTIATLVNNRVLQYVNGKDYLLQIHIEGDWIRLPDHTYKYQWKHTSIQSNS